MNFICYTTVDAMDVENIKKKQKFQSIKNFQTTLENLFSKADENLAKDAIVIDIGGSGQTFDIGDEEENQVVLQSIDKLLIEEEERELEEVSLEFEDHVNPTEQLKETQDDNLSKTFDTIGDLEKKIIGYIQEVPGAGWKCRKCQIIFFQEVHLRESLRRVP